MPATLAPEPPIVSGPQGPRVVIEGRPVLMLCSSNYLGFADHPRVRQAAAEAALRWGAGAGGARPVSGHMTPHAALEGELAAFHDAAGCVLFGSGHEAALGVVGALAGPGEVVFCDAAGPAASHDGCRLSGADVFLYAHGDADHLEWGLRRFSGRPGLIMTDGVFALDGDVAPLSEIVALAQAYGVRTVVDEAHGTGALGAGGRGAVAEAGLLGEVDVVIGSLGTALGAYGAFAFGAAEVVRAIAGRARSLRAATALPPPAVAAAGAALGLLVEQPRRVEKLQANADALRRALAREGFEVAGSTTQVVPLVVGEASLADRMAALALEGGVLVQAVAPADVPEGTARLRLAVMASHTKPELREAAQVLGRAALRAGFRPGAGVPLAAAA